MEKKLDSGAVLKITLAPFEQSHDLWQALLAEGVDLKMHGSDELSINLIKDALCVALSSKRITANLRPCMERATYTNVKGVTGKCVPDTFEDELAREDYLEVCYEVAKANVYPFVKRLYAKFRPQWEKLKEALK